MGLTTDLVVTLAQIPAKSIILDVVVADILLKFGMLLPRSWDSNLNETLQMDMPCATIPLFGEHRILYRENKLAYVVSSQDKPNNYRIDAVDTDMGYSIFFNDYHIEQDV